MEQAPSSLDEYRAQLIESEREAQTAFDRTLLTLSGGALGLSLTFVDRLIGPSGSATGLLYASWILWTLSLSIMLSSHYMSTLAMRKAITQVDKGKIYDEKPGGAYDVVIKVLNPIGAVSFLAGVITMVCFVSANKG